jgi:hypothetical protein
MSTPRFVNHKHIQGFTAAEDLAAYRCVIITASDSEQCEYPAAQYDYAFGVTAAAADSGKPVDVVIEGIALVTVDGNAANIAAGDRLCVHTATGYAQKVAGGAAGNRKTFGTALAASTADGDVIPVLLSPGDSYFAS